MKSQKINNGLVGIVKIPGDKSISHRSIIIPAISNGISEVSNILISEDVNNTIKAFELMNVKIKKFKKKIKIYGKGLDSLKKPKKDIYLGNSGTSARLLIGLLSAQSFDCLLTGDKSLSKRPMKRITNPLQLMNARFKTNKGKLPIKIYGTVLLNKDHKIKIPSAQIKSGLLLAALNTKGETVITEENITRDHTEKMLKSFGANIKIKKINKKNKISIIGKKELKAKNIFVPSDLSSSAFFIIAALINKKSKIKLNQINLNPTRDGILRALKKMGGNIKITNKKTINDEVVGDIIVQSSELVGCTLNKSMAKLMIDEYPILSVAAAFAKSPSIFKGLGELRVKESDRLELIRLNLNRCGFYCKITDDDLYIDPNKKSKIQNNKIKTNFDHRIAMAFAVMGSKIGNLVIEQSECISTSFPSFVNQFNKVGGNIIEK